VITKATTWEKPTELKEADEVGKVLNADFILLCSDFHDYHQHCHFATITVTVFSPSPLSE
jgi:hypothetical protein